MHDCKGTRKRVSDAYIAQRPPFHPHRHTHPEERPGGTLKSSIEVFIFKIEAIAQLHTDLCDSCLCWFFAGVCEALPVAARQADKPLTDPAGLEGLSTVILTASQHQHNVLTLAGLHGSVRGKLVTSCSLHPSTLTHIKGNLIAAQRNGHSVIHNESRFEVLGGHTQLLANPVEEGDVDDNPLQQIPERL